MKWYVVVVLLVWCGVVSSIDIGCLFNMKIFSVCWICCELFGVSCVVVLGLICVSCVCSMG